MIGLHYRPLSLSFSVRAEALLCKRWLMRLIRGLYEAEIILACHGSCSSHSSSFFFFSSSSSSLTFLTGGVWGVEFRGVNLACGWIPFRPSTYLMSAESKSLLIIDHASSCNPALVGTQRPWGQLTDKTSPSFIKTTHKCMHTHTHTPGLEGLWGHNYGLSHLTQRVYRSFSYFMFICKMYVYSFICTMNEYYTYLKYLKGWDWFGKWLDLKPCLSGHLDLILKYWHCSNLHNSSPLLLCNYILINMALTKNYEDE